MKLLKNIIKKCVSCYDEPVLTHHYRRISRRQKASGSAIELRPDENASTSVSVLRVIFANSIPGIP